MKTKDAAAFGAAVLFAALSFTLILTADKTTPQQKILKKLGATKALIVNGDDFGYKDDINRGIVRGFRDGILTSSSLMVPAPACAAAYKLIAENPSLDVGVHLTLAQDVYHEFGPLTPAAKVPSLVDKDGFFPTAIKPIQNANRNEIRTELTAQLDAALANGVDVTHFDCHKGFYHTYDTKMLKIIIDLAVKYRLPIRWQGKSSDSILTSKGIVTPDFMTTVAIPGPVGPKKVKLLKLIDDLPDGITEIVLHPAEGDIETYDRATLLALALDPDVKAEIQKKGIKLIGYKVLREAMRENGDN